MIRGILEKGTSRVMGSAQQQQQPSASSSGTAGAAGADEKATASTSSTSTASSSAESSGNGNGNGEQQQRRATGRPKTNSEDSTTGGTGGGNFFRDSTVPIAKSISKSAGKIFRSADRNHAAASDPHANPQHPHTHHPQHSSSTSSSSNISSSTTNKTLSSSSSSNNLMHGMTGGAEPRPGKKCSLCGKNFNPLRRRYFCRVCTVEVCSNCSLKRKVDSSLEGAISIRICMACKMNTSAPQSDYYDRAFSVASALHPGGDDGIFGGDVFGDGGSSHGDRASAVSFMSAVSHSKPEKRRPFSSASSVTSSSSAAATTPGNYRGKQQSTQQQQQTNAAGLVSGGLRRTSSSASAQSGVARSRRDSFGSVAAPPECQMCMNEACGPMIDLAEVPYPVMETKGPSGNERFIRARSLDNEKERLDSVRKIRRVLTDTPNVAQRFAQLCSMASIATQSRIAVIALLDKDDYFVVSESGLPVNATPVSRTLALASHTCRNGAPLVCSDMGADLRFAGNPWRRDTLNVLFYAGIPLTLANGHTIGVIEVFDKHTRYACMDVVTQLQAVVRGLLKKFEEILASVLAETTTESEAAAEEDPIALAIAALERSTSYGDVKPSSGAPRSPVRRAPAPPPPATAPFVAAPAPTAAPEPAPAPAALPEPTPAAQVAPAAPAAGPTENEMEMRLMELLSQTTSTQEQLRNQQGHMVHAISSHSKQISDLAKQLERMESTLASKLDGIPAAPASKPEAAAPSSPGVDSPETPAP